MYKMIVVDLDGTLLNPNKQINENNKKFLIEKQKVGYTLTIASGRPYLGIVDYAKQLKMDEYNGFIIGYNGALLYDVANDKVLINHSIKSDDAKEILTHLEKFDLIKMITKDEYMYVDNVYNCMINVNNEKRNIVDYESNAGNFLLCEKRPLSEKLDFDINKILIAQDPEYLLKHHKEISKPFINKYNMVFSEPFYFEVTSKFASKGLALSELAKMLNINLSEIIGFGDDLNDLSFLKIIGHPVTMENANAKVIEEIANICGSNENDSIAIYLNKHI